MNRITVDDRLKTQPDGLDEPADVVDETGRRLGHFVPAVPTASDDCPYSSDELERMRREEGGRPLADVWRALDAR